MHVGDLIDDPVLVSVALVSGAALVLLAAVALAGRLWRGAEAGPVAPQPAEDPAPGGVGRLRRECDRLAEYAGEAAARARRAETEAAAARERSAAAEAIRRRAWSQYETVELPVVAEPSRAAAGAAAARPADPPAGGAVGESVAHAAFVAFRRGAISAREMQRVWSGAAAPTDPRREERRRDLARRMARQREARYAYQRAAAVARLTEEQARIAEVAAQALAAEAADAEGDVLQARAAVERCLGPAA